jgi:hypothetical protein
MCRMLLTRTKMFSMKRLELMMWEKNAFILCLIGTRQKSTSSKDIVKCFFQNFLFFYWLNLLLQRGFAAVTSTWTHWRRKATPAAGHQIETAVPDGRVPELINKIDTKAKCRHLKNWHVKGLCGISLSEWRLEIQLWTLPFSLVQVSPYPPSLCQSTVYTDSVWLGGGGGVESYWRSYSAGV